MAKKILFVCTGNTCRSTMAHGLAQKLTKELAGANDLMINSAGTHAYLGAPASRGAIQALAEQGINASEHRATTLTKELVQEADLILVMTTNHKSYILDWVPEAAPKVFLLKEFALGQLEQRNTSNYSIGDPFGQPVEVYRDVAEELKELVTLALIRISRQEGKLEFL